jgi:Ni/Co efflux regulator RcnB
VVEYLRVFRHVGFFFASSLNGRLDMKPTKFSVILVASMALVMFTALAGCGDDRHDYGRDRDRSPDRERRDNDRHDEHRDGDRHDEHRDSDRHD